MGSGETVKVEFRSMFERFWEWASRLSLLLLMAVLGGIWDMHGDIGELENRVTKLEGRSESMEEMKRDIKVLLDRTARIETKMETIP